MPTPHLVCGPMTRVLAAFAVGLLFFFFGTPELAQAQPRVYKLGLVITDAVLISALPAHLQARHSQLVADLRGRMRVLLSQLGRFQVFNWDATLEENRYTYHGVEGVDFVLQVLLHRADKIVRNQVIYAYEGVGLPPIYGAHEGGLDYEIVSLPAISDRLEIRLVEPHKGKVFWSTQRDSTVIVPYNNRLYILNPRKYPGLNPPVMLQNYLADVMRLRQDNRAIDRLLDVADRWFVSKPAGDIEVAQALLGDLVQSFGAEIDGNLPLEGEITELLPSDRKLQVRIDIGARQGLVPALRLEVWRPLPAAQKVGELELVQVDSTTSIAVLKNLDKQIRKRGEGLAPLDRVISPKRPPSGRRKRL